MSGDKTNVHAYTELATGLNVWNPANGRWEESDPAFDLADGVAVSRRTQHRLTLASQINAANGTVDLLAPDGRRFRSTVLGLTLFNRRTGRSLALAELKSDSPVGELIASNAVLYPDCFDNLRADVRVENRRDGFHHDVILRESLDGAALTAAGFPPEVSMLEIWTAWLEAPEPKVEARVVKSTDDPAQRALMVEPDITDESLDFGAIQFGAGVAYLAPEAQPDTSVPVTKRWLKRDGRSYLVESCELSTLQPMFAALPRRKTGQDDEQLIAGRRPPSPSLIEHSTNSLLVASADNLRRATAPCR